MIEQTSAKLLRELELSLNRLKVQEQEPLEKLVQSLKQVKDSIEKLRSIVELHPFRDKDSEINFFKYTKPAFFCHQIYCAEMYTIETGLPFGDIDKQLLFLEGELMYIERYFKKYAFQYQYYKLDAKDLDTLYFLRGIEVQSIILPNASQSDELFSTSCDYLFAKFKAFELLKSWLLEKQVYLKSNPAAPFTDLTSPSAEHMRWTGDTVNLAELGYGLYCTGQLNNGTAGISQIFRWLEEKLQVNIGIPAKRFAAIRGRKRLSQTKYMDEMKDSILKKIEKDDGYSPNQVNRRGRELD